MKLLNGLRTIPFRVAATTMSLLLAALFLLHILVLLGVLPYELFWGGRINGHEQMQVMESVSLLITALMYTAVAAKAGKFDLSRFLPRCYIDLGLWLMVVMLLLNTLGNLSAHSGLETLIFTPLSLLAVLLTIRIALGNESPTQG